MADNKSKAERSRNMSAVKNKGTAPEVYIMKLLFKKGFRYRKNVDCIKGKPDIWLKKYNTAIFVHGCFWHQHKNCKYSALPQTNYDFWQEKLNKNRVRDKLITDELNKIGIKCLIIWGCTVKQAKKDCEKEKTLILQITDFLQNQTLYYEL